MTKVKTIVAAVLLLMSYAQPLFAQSEHIYQSEDLTVSKLTEKTFVHVSYLSTESFGKVACNGLMVVDGGEAVVIDTPVNDSVASELIRWIREELDSRVKAVVATHFHEDCLGGLTAFHQSGATSYAHDLTIALAKEKEHKVPQQGFADSLEIPVGQEKVLCTFLGEGHTLDNSVCYVPSERVLFGGCLVKATGASEGNLEDANVDAWPATVTGVKHRFSDAAYVVPGHGKPGGSDLLDYTVRLFTKN